ESETAGALTSAAATQRVLASLGEDVTDADRQFAAEEIAIRATATADADVAYALEPLASRLPRNPREIKRVINAVTVYGAVALPVMGWHHATERWMQLARW